MASYKLIYLQLSAQSKGRTARLHVDHYSWNKLQAREFLGKRFYLVNLQLAI